jgi:hypothetical protein
MIIQQEMTATFMDNAMTGMFTMTEMAITAGMTATTLPKGKEMKQSETSTAIIRIVSKLCGKLVPCVPLKKTVKFGG